MWLGRYGGQRWADLDAMPLRELELHAAALGYLLDEESPPPTANGR